MSSHQLMGNGSFIQWVWTPILLTGTNGIPREISGKTAFWVMASVSVLVGVTTMLLWTLKSLNYWLYLRPLRLANGSKLPPGYLGLPLFGNMKEFLHCFKNEMPDRFVANCVDRHGNIGLYTTHLFGMPSIMVTSPEAIKFVLKRDDVFGTGWPSMNKIMGRASVVSVSGEKHKRLRRYLFDAIASPVGMAKALPHMEETIKTSLKQWAAAGKGNIRDATKMLTFHVIVENFLTLKPSPELDAMVKEYEGLMQGIRALPIYLPGMAHYKAVSSRKRIVARFERIINNRRKSTIHYDDFLQLLMDARDTNGVALTSEELTDNLVTCLLAGHESSSYTMMWIMILVTKNPEVLTKLREEHVKIREQLGDNPLTLEIIRAMTYSSKVFNETLRLVNIAPMAFRSVLQDVDYEGYRFPKGWKAMPWLRAPHMDGAYFEEPEKFDPDRWNTVNDTLQAYNPFGCGTRTCVGNQFAKLEVFAFLHHLVVGYKWELLNPNAKVIHLPHPKPIDGATMIFSTL